MTPPASEHGERPRKVAILGGGMAALTAAFELTAKPDWQKHYEITVYQIGWRLGGKGASGRNREKHDRIEEHGLHVWLGFYHHAFSLIRRCYAELDRAPGEPLADWQDAFQPCNHLAGIEYFEDQWLPWEVAFPEAPGLPGDPRSLPEPGLWQVARKVFRYFLDFEKANGSALFRGGPTSKLGFGPSLKIKGCLLGVALLELGAQVLRLSGQKKSGGGFGGKTLIGLLDRCLRVAGNGLESRMATDHGARRSWIVLDYLVAVLKGFHGEGITGFHDMDRLNQYDFREFLQKYGASKVTLDSPVVHALYNLGFAYLQGKKSKPSLAAGVITGFSLRMFFHYRGALFWKMRAGMGDAVFAPIYQVLKRRGVRFRFFHRVRELALSPDGARISEVLIGQQALLRDEARGYEPLIGVRGLPCWPDRPLFEQLAEGEALKLSGEDLESDWCAWADRGEAVLRHGRDFDEVVLGIGLGALPRLCRPLMDANPAFREMVERVPTVPTCAMQLWLRPELSALGWKQPASLIDGNREAMATWSDMTQTAPLESWPEGEVGHIAYFCSVMEDPEEPATPDKARQSAEGQASAQLSRIGLFWPRAVLESGSLNPELLAGDPKLAKFVKANINGSDRYVLAAKGTIGYRLRPDRSGFTNLVLTGDWTDNGLNYGCIEAAVLSGILAARAVVTTGAEGRSCGSKIQSPTKPKNK